MHVTIRLQGKAVIILSEGATEKLTQRLRQLVECKNLKDKKALNKYIHALWEYTILVPGEGYPFDVSDFFDEHQDELEIFINLLTEAFAEVQKEEPLKEAHVVQSYLDLLSEYLEKLRNQSTVPLQL